MNSTHFIYKGWWKIISVLILAYVIIVGFLTPLKPGILDCTPVSSAQGKELTMEVVGYNSHYSTTTEFKAFLKRSDQLVLEARSILPINETVVKLVFDVPVFSDENTSCTLILNSTLDGSSILPNAVVLAASESTEIALNTNSQWKDFDVSALSQLEGFRFPFRNILHETVRNTFFHVAIWFAMFTLFTVSLIYSIMYLLNNKYRSDMIASSFTSVGVVFGLIGLATGSIWAKYTWGAFWTSDVKLNMSAVAILIYCAYFVLRSSITDIDSKARISAAYNVFSFLIMIPLLFVLPRMTASLHPGNGGNPALGGEDLDNTLRMVFYPAIIGLTLLGVWLSTLRYRVKALENVWLEEE